MEDMFAISMPFDLQVNKDLDHIRQTHERWVDESGVLASEEEKRVLLAANVPKLVAYTFPSLTGDALALFTEFMAWSFLFDDEFDAPKERVRWVERVEVMIQEYRHVLYGGECRRDATPLIRAWDDILRRVEALASESVVRRHQQSWDDVYDACRKEAKNDEAFSLPSFAEDWLLFELPEAIRADETFRAMKEHTADVVDMVNDVYSLRKEIKCGNTDNAVLVFANEHSCSLDESKAAVVQMIIGNLNKFQQAEKAFRMSPGYRGLVGEDRGNVEEYVSTMKNWMVGTFEWQKGNGSPPPHPHPHPQHQEAGQPPPGPKGVPLLGNIFDLPPKGVPEHEHWSKHKALYGAISSVTVLGQTIVVIHDKDVASDLLEKQSAKTSGRPEMEFACNLAGWKRFLGTRPLDAIAKRYRKFIHQDVGTKALASKYDGIQNEEAGHLLLRTLKNPNELVNHFKTEAGAAILKILYGYSIEQHQGDPLLRIVETAMHGFSVAFVPGAWAVDTLPMLKYIPEGLPFTGFKKTAREFRRAINDSIEIPYNFTRDRMANHSSRTSYVSELVSAHNRAADSEDEYRITADDEEIIKMSAAAMYGGGADTTVASLSAFVLAMIRFPDVQRKAQEELDRVVGDRIPQLSDRDSLPYINAIASEVLRWWPIAPLSVPHRAEEDITYQGYLIPKGAIILPPILSTVHDPVTYANPSSFDPDRYLPRATNPTPDLICPGRYIADSGIFVSVAQMLKVFTISRAVDSLGREIEPTATMIPGVIAHPTEFPYKIEPRSERHAEMILDLERAHPWEASDSGLLVHDY
ncbi:Cytochrome P450 monooxygenase CLM2 [Cladobotryum mycophilum]|uniref:Cytochrome P450 monooxygenase CLM2 n=1 Tax=Cladobotryum mycophilum TaxID=491253 RepID=A0ABR0SIR6_9HYPO